MSQPFRWPLPQEFSRTSSPFGTRRHPVTHKKQKHSGIDVSCPQGTEIHAPCDGTIRSVWRDEGFGGGLSVTIEADGNPIRIGFAHLSEVFVRRGNVVVRGAFIARSGGTPGTPGAGRSTGPHLHITVRDIASGKLLDPDKLTWEGRGAE